MINHAVHISVKSRQDITPFVWTRRLVLFRRGSGFVTLAYSEQEAITGLMKARNTAYPVFRLGTKSSVVCGSLPTHQATTPRTTRSRRGSEKILLSPKTTWKRNSGDLSLHRRRPWRSSTALTCIPPHTEGRGRLFIVRSALMYHLVRCPHLKHTL